MAVYHLPKTSGNFSGDVNGKTSLVCQNEWNILKGSPKFSTGMLGLSLCNEGSFAPSFTVKTLLLSGGDRASFHWKHLVLLMSLVPCT